MGFLPLHHLEQDLRDEWNLTECSFPFTFMLIQERAQAPSLTGSEGLCA